MSLTLENKVAIITGAGSGLGKAYACSKAGIVTMTQALARELGPKGIRVNAVAPGLTETEAALGLPNEQEMFDGTIALQSIKRRGTTRDLSGVAAFLASDDADFVTGQYYIVDGGAAFAF